MKGRSSEKEPKGCLRRGGGGGGGGGSAVGRPPKAPGTALGRTGQSQARTQRFRRPSRPPPSRQAPVRGGWGRAGHGACALRGVTRVGKPSASAILAASVGLFSYHVNRRRRPGRGEVAAALSERGEKGKRRKGEEEKEKGRRKGCQDRAARRPPRGLAAAERRIQGCSELGQRRRRRRRADRRTDRAGRWREPRGEPEPCRP